MSNRDTIINALKKATVSIVEELVDVTGWPERKVRDTLGDLKKIGVVTFERDEVTTKAAYRLAKPGEAIKAVAKPAALSLKKTVTPVVKKSLTTEKPTVRENRTVEMPTDKACCNAAVVVATTAGAEVAAFNKQLAAKDEWIDAAKRKIADLENEHADLKTELADFGKQNSVLTTELIDASNDRDSKCDTINSMSNAVIKFCGITAELTGGGKYPLNLYECELLLADRLTYMERKITTLQSALNAAQAAAEDFEPEDALIGEIGLLRAENKALNILNTAMPDFGATHEAISAGPFVIRTTGKPPRFTTKHANAQSVAMSAARQHGAAEVFALIPVGKAVRGPVWKDSK